MADIKTIFGAIDHLDTYQRVNSTHLLDLYVGIDAAARWTLLLISEYPPMKVTSSRMILVKSGRRPIKSGLFLFLLLMTAIAICLSCFVRILSVLLPVSRVKRKPPDLWENDIKSGGKCWQIPLAAYFPRKK